MAIIMKCRRKMTATSTTTDELAEATERVLTDSEWVVDGVPAEVTNVTNVEGDLWIDTNAGMFTKSEWHTKVCHGEIQRV